MSAMNPDLVTASGALNDLARTIHDEKSVTNDPNAYRALNDALIEINHRIAIIGGLIFAERSDDIAAAAEQVQSGTEELQQAIARIDRLNNFLQTITQFLGLVDNLIGVARQVALGA
jgi:hypothetical protein